LAVDTVDWSHGYWRILSDHFDYAHSRCEGRRLAAEILAFHALSPDKDVYLVAHSAGSGVALAAADVLPPNSVRRILLLAPSVASDYDLRPALRCARDGVEVFYSSCDVLYLGVWTTMLGTTDRHWCCPAAGRTGFCPLVQSPDDVLLYGKLHQHAWDPCVAWSGNLGGHYGPYQAGYLRAYILPLLTCP
jgi:pimeloyl-ACP methyl ester carboxylesterase